MTRRQIVFDHLERGQRGDAQGPPDRGLAAFRSALRLDPQNEFAHQRLRDAMGEWTPKISAPPQVLADAGEIRVAPDSARAEVHYRGDSRGLLAQVASAFGVTATFDESVISRQVRFDLGKADFYTALEAACSARPSFPLSSLDLDATAKANEERGVEFDHGQQTMTSDLAIGFAATWKDAGMLITGHFSILGKR
jgi:hypothetical protein